MQRTFSQAVRWNLIESNPMDRVQVRKAAPAKEKPMCFTREQAETFLTILEKPLVYEYGQRLRKDASGNVRQIQEYQADRSVRLQLKLFFYLAMFTGCRRGELIALTWNDLDFAEGSNRVIAVPAIVMDVARRWKKEQAAYRLSIGTKGQGADIRTVSGRLGHASTSTTLNIYSHALKELDKAASDKLEEALFRSIR